MSEQKTELHFKLRGQSFAEDVSEASARTGAAMRRAIAQIALTSVRVAPFDADAFLRSFQSSSEHVARAVANLQTSCASSVEGIGRCVFAVGELYRQAEEIGPAVGHWAASLPDDEREELRRAIEDAPLEPVDVNAEGVM